MEELKEIGLLHHVKRVEVPLHLKSRIDARITNNESDSLPVRWLWLAAASVAVLITINTLSIRSEFAESRSSGPSEQITTGLGIQTSNQLY